MEKRRIKRLVATVACLLIITAISYMSLWGRLVPYSPLVVGFERKTFEQATIYYHHGQILPEAIDSVCEFMSDLESLHALTYQRKVDVLFCSSEDEEKRFGGTTVRAITYAPYGRILISEKLRRESCAGDKPFADFLKHELTHSLIDQNISVYRLLRFFPSWLNEGLAVCSANQFGRGGYCSREEVIVLLRQGHFYKPEWFAGPLRRTPEEAKAFPVEDRMYFAYSEYGMIVDDLIRTYGRERFQKYLHALLRTGSHDEVFQQSFGLPFDQYLEAFRARMIGSTAESNSL
jgi:hypothetical protein